MGTRTISTRSQFGFALAALICAATPAALAQTPDFVVVCDGAGCGAFELFLPASQIFDAADGETLDDAMLFALDPTNGIETVQITQGTWPFIGNSQIAEPITVRGVGDPAQTIVQNTGTGPTFDLTGMDIVIEGITISAGVGSGVAVSMGSNAVINRCIVIGNANDGISVTNDSEPIIVNCAFTNYGSGAGVRVNTAAGQTDIAHCTFVENAVGVAAVAGNVRIQASLFEINTAAIEVTGGAAGGGDNLLFMNGTGEILGAVAPSASVLPAGTPALRWYGQIDPTPAPATPAADGAMDLSSDATLAPYVGLDLDGNARPIGGGNDHGADEGGLGIQGTPSLIFVAYFPNPIGRLAEGELAVVLQFSASVDIASFTDPDYALVESSKVILWPQSLVGDHTTAFNPPGPLYNTPAVGDYAIPLNMELVSDQFWIGFNAVPIDNELRTPPNSGLIELNHGYDANQIYLDGRADLLVHIGTGFGTGDLIPTVNLEMFLDTEDLQPIIDTHAAQLYIDPTLTGLKPGTLPNDRLITNAGNDTLFADGIRADLRAGAPLSVAGAINYPSTAFWTFTLFQEIEPNPVAGGPSVFYNTDADYGVTGGTVQPIIPANLTHSVTAEFIDLPPLDSADNPIIAIVPSGFQIGLTAANGPITVDELNGDLSRGFLMPRWIFETGFNKLSSVNAAPLTINAAFDQTPIIIGADTFPFLRATWNLDNLGYALADNDADPFRYRVNFAAIDAAFNIPAGEDELLDPLTVWWFVRTESQIVPTNWDSEFVTPNFTWRLKRNADPGLGSTTEPARPSFAYRFLYSINPQNPIGPYAPMRGGTFGINTNVIDDDGWSPRYTYGTGLPFSWFEQNTFTTNPLIVDRWLIMLTTAIDEAGNVEALPYNNLVPSAVGPTGLVRLSNTDPLNPAGQELYVPATPPNRNWVRFYIPGAGASLDTGDLNGSISATFWHENFNVNAPNAMADPNESIFEQAHIVPLPPVNQFDPLDLINRIYFERVNVEFDVAFSAQQTTGSIGYIWVLERDGVPIDQDVSLTYLAAAGPQMESFGLPRSTPSPIPPTSNPTPAPSDYFGDGERDRAVNYVLKVATVRLPLGGMITSTTVQTGPNGFYSFEAPTGGLYEIDETPINYAFIVTPEVGDYIENKTSPDNQPVKVIEAN